MQRKHAGVQHALGTVLAATHSFILKNGGGALVTIQLSLWTLAPWGQHALKPQPTRARWF